MRGLGEGESAADILSKLTAQDTQAEHPVPRRVTIMVTLMAVLFVVVPALFWHDTWFGRPLDNEEIAEYLADIDKPRKAQHALAQISGRITEGDAAAKQWYPQIIKLADHSLPELRLTAAWVMGQDVQEKPFQDKLHEMLDDPQPIVRRNAALSLASFNDPAGRVVLLAMLRPFTVQSADSGVLTNRLESGDVVDRDTLLARVARQTRASPPRCARRFPELSPSVFLRTGRTSTRAMTLSCSAPTRHTPTSPSAPSTSSGPRKTSRTSGASSVPMRTCPPTSPNRHDSPLSKSVSAPPAAARQAGSA